MNILIAPNAFKHALSAPDAAESIRQGLLESKLDCACRCFPIGDGGNGTCGLLIDRLGGERVEVDVSDPLGRPVTASFGLVDGGQTAVVELADASGLHLLTQTELDPLRANTYGTGQLIKAALDLQVKRIVVGMGGSATVDGGTGLLAALGVRFLDRDGREIVDLPIGLERLHALDSSGVDSRLADCGITIMCDVTNPLLGRDGAARVFGPQKGASPQQVGQLERLLGRFAEVVRRDIGVGIGDMVSGGVAGGASAGMAGLLGSRLVNGIDYFLDLTQVDDELGTIDLVITAEGSIDEQTLQGKGPFGVAKRAKASGIPVIGLAGRIPHEIEGGLNDYFDSLIAINPGAVSLAEALPATAANLRRTAMQLGNLIAAVR